MVGLEGAVHGVWLLAEPGGVHATTTVAVLPTDAELGMDPVGSDRRGSGMTKFLFKILRWEALLVDALDLGHFDPVLLRVLRLQLAALAP